MMMYNRHNDFVGVMYENKVINTIIIKSNSNSSCMFVFYFMFVFLFL